MSAVFSFFANYFRFILAFALFAASAAVNAEFFIPQSLGGQITYGYGLNRAVSAESETTTIGIAVGGSGFFWEPWFLTMGATVGLSLGESTSNPGGTTQSSSVNGDVNFTLFPRSRFPTDFGYAVTNSSSESVDYVRTRDQEYEVRRFYINQHYTGTDNFRLSAWLNQSTIDSYSDDDSEVWSFGIEANKRQAYQILDGGLRLNKTNTVNNPQESKDSSFYFNHGYYPGAEQGIISLINLVRSSNQVASGTTTETSSGQASSTFYWRPEHKPYHVSGGVRFYVSDPDKDTEQRSASSNISASYRVSRNTRVAMGINFSVIDASAGQATTVSEVVNADYNSDPHRFFGLDYAWGAGMSFSNTNTSSDRQTQTNDSTDQNAQEEESPDSIQATGASFSHRLTKSWLLGRYSSAHFSIGQGGGASKSSAANEPVYSAVHSAGMGWSRSASGAQTSVSMQASDSRSYAEEADNIFQSFNFQLARQQVINRLSGITGTVNYQASQAETIVNQDNASQTTTSTAQTNDDDKLNEGGGASLSYYHSRFLGIYKLRLDSSLATRNLFRSESDTGAGSDNDREGNINLDWRNNLTYNIGLLFVSISYNVSDMGDGDKATSLFFRATRSF